MLTELKRTIIRRAMRERYINQVIPFSWLEVYDRMQSQNQRVQTLQAVEGTAQSCKMQVDDVPPMLRLFHQRGLLMHHAQEAVKDSVILDPFDFLVKPASKVQLDALSCTLKVELFLQIICLHDSKQKYHRIAGVKEPKLYRQLKEGGILNTRLLEQLWGEEIMDKKTILNLMELYSLVVAFTSAGGMCTEYLVPAMLPDKIQEESEKASWVAFILICPVEKLKAWDAEPQKLHLLRSDAKVVALVSSLTWLTCIRRRGSCRWASFRAA
eukprot:396739-Hanusia_phi.AAC.3